MGEQAILKVPTNLRWILHIGPITCSSSAAQQGPENKGRGPRLMKDTSSRIKSSALQRGKIISGAEGIHLHDLMVPKLARRACSCCCVASSGRPRTKTVLPTPPCGTCAHPSVAAFLLTPLRCCCTWDHYLPSSSQNEITVWNTVFCHPSPSNDPQQPLCSPYGRLTARLL